MQMACISASVLAWLTLGLPAAAPVAPGEIIVTAPQVEIRSGPSEQCQPTCRVKQGDRLSALHAVSIGPGWLAIKPPPGSSSWVKATALKRAADGKTGVLVLDRAPVWVGSSIISKKPNVSQGALKRGESVEILGPDHQDEEASWTPIRPPAFEVRYVLVSEVGDPGPGKETTATASRPPAQQDDLAELRARLQQLARRLEKLEAAKKKH